LCVFRVCGKLGKSGFGKRNLGKKSNTLEEIENRSGRIGKDPLIALSLRKSRKTAISHYYKIQES
jgi:hypothetical protein